MRRAPAVLLLLLLASALATTAHWLGRAGLDRFLAPAASIGSTGAVPEPGVQTSRRVVLVLADGLGVRDARRMPVLERLARQGAFYTVTGPDPAWPLPAWATVLTGTEPMVHRALFPERPTARVPTILGSLRGSGAGTAAAGSPLFLALAGNDAAQKAALLPDGALKEPLAAVMAAKASLTVIHLDWLHPLDHRLTVRSPQDLLMDLDAGIAAVAGGLNLVQDTLIITGTFSTGPAGEHGDGSRPVPIILAGNGIRAEAQGRGDLRDLAPTMAALLSVPKPAAATGQILPQALSLGQAAGQAAVQDAGTPPSQFAGPLFSSRRWTTMWAGIKPWWPSLAVFLVTAVLYLLVLARQPFGPNLTKAVAIYLVTYHVALAVSGGEFGPELPGLELLNRQFWRQQMSAAAIAMSLAALYVGVAVGRRGGRRAGHAAVVALHTTLAVIVTLALETLAAVVWSGWPPNPATLGLTWSIKYLLDLVQVVALGYGALGWIAIGLIGYALSVPRARARGGGSRSHDAGRGGDQGGGGGGGKNRRPALVIVPSGGRGR